MTMRLCYVSAWTDPARNTPQELVSARHTLRELAREQVSLGHQVGVVQVFQDDARLVIDEVDFRFVRHSGPAFHASQFASCLWPGVGAPYFQVSRRLPRAIAGLNPDIIHFFGLTLDLHLWQVLREARRRGALVVAQYHGGEPSRNMLRRFVQRRNLRSTDRLLFTTENHARPWIESGVTDESRIRAVMETSSVFRWRPRDEARAETGMTGDPVFVWTGRLHPEKDPLTALRGFERIVACRPAARLYCYYLTEELLPTLREFVTSRPSLREAVEFQGRAPFQAMEAIYNSADFFLQCSLREVSGTAPVEAMACGVIPVLSNIPSFRAMTEDARYGILFPIGDDASLAGQVLTLPPQRVSELSESVRAHWKSHLSYPAIARRLDVIYREALAERAARARS
jgi:glycosyltransferase involved in cell wall biosynthesis